MTYLKRANTALMGIAPIVIIALMGTTLISHAAPTVTGIGGCILNNGQQASFDDKAVFPEGTYPDPSESGGGPGVPTSNGHYTCGTDQKVDGDSIYTNAPDAPGSSIFTQGNFVTDDEINRVLNQVYQDLGNTYDPATDNAQDGRLDNLEDGSVMYNRDANGNKTGGVTFNDGTGNPVQLANVAAGKAGTDAVNVDQLTGALDGLGGGAKVNPDGSVTGPTYIIGGNSYDNVGDALRAQGDLSVQYVADENGKPTNNVILTGDGTGAPVKISNVAAGTEDTDAVNYSQIKNNVGYDQNEDGSRGDTITLVGGSTGPVTIQNLADGKKDSDAATVRQVNQARQDSFDYTDQQVSVLREQNNARFDALSGEISDVRSEARAGVASAMAAAGLRFDDRPGKASIAGGLGGFKTATSMAVGAGYTSEDGRWRMNGTVAHSFSTNDTAWNAGASWTFN